MELKGSKTVRFADRTELNADLLIWATGWKSNLFPFTSTEKSELQQQAESYVLHHFLSIAVLFLWITSMIIPLFMSVRYKHVEPVW